MKKTCDRCGEVMPLLVAHRRRHPVCPALERAKREAAQRARRKAANRKWCQQYQRRWRDDRRTARRIEAKLLAAEQQVKHERWARLNAQEGW